MSVQRTVTFSKELQPIQDYIRTCDLYRQTAGANPLYILLPFDGVNDTFEQGVLLATIKNEVGDIYINKHNMIARAERALNQEQTGRPVLHEEYVHWCQERDKHFEYAQYLSTNDLRTQSESDIIKELKVYNAINHAMWRYSFIIDCFDPNGAELLQERVWKLYPSISNEEREILLHHNEPTTPELMERRALELLISKQPNAAEQLRKEFHWIENNYTGVRHLPLDHFTSFINECDLRYPNDSSRKTRMQQIQSTPNSRTTAKKKLIDAYCISSEHQRCITVFSLLTDWREERKRNTQMMAWCFQQFIDALAQQWKCEPTLVAQAHSEEYDLFALPREQKLSILTRRKATGVVYTMDNRNGQRTFIDQPEDVQAVFKLINEKLYNKQQKEIHGTVARKGKIQGVARIVNHSNEFEKFQDGDILVSGMTRPELMPVIRKAGGIITDEGGITCHAAVVSRELGIPCIIGTQVATRMLNDGDVVMLDADNGVVYKVEPSQQ